MKIAHARFWYSWYMFGYKSTIKMNMVEYEVCLLAPLSARRSTHRKLQAPIKLHPQKKKKRKEFLYVSPACVLMYASTKTSDYKADSIFKWKYRILLIFLETMIILPFSLTVISFTHDVLIHQERKINELCCSATIQTWFQRNVKMNDSTDHLISNDLWWFLFTFDMTTHVFFEVFFTKTKKTYWKVFTIFF
jgi:hypothetical protein